MKIGIDARFYTVHGGLGRYVSELIHELILLPSQHEFYIFLPSEATLETRNERIHLIRTSIPWYGWKEQILWPLLLNHYKLDLVHFPHFNIPLAYAKPFVVTIHDLILLRHNSARVSQLHPLWYRVKARGYRLALSQAIKRSRHIITTSQFTKKDLQSVFTVPDSRISVTYQASRWPTISVELERKKQLLYVGNCYPHKNIGFLIKAFSQFYLTHPEYTLVIAGHADSFFLQLKQKAEELYPQIPITFLADCSDQQLAQLYASSECYLFPSRYEGFGLPGLEAMAFGLPVLSSNSSCLPEIYGSAALYFQDNDQTDFLQKLSSLCTDPAKRETLRIQGFERVKKFSWPQLAVDTLAIYERSVS